MKLKNIALLSIISTVVLGCAERYSPDELNVIKYKPLVIPEKLVLVKPIKGKKSLGYIEPRNVISTETLAYYMEDKNYHSILTRFNIKDIDESIRKELEKPTGSTILLDIKAEQKRIDDNLAQGKPITDGETPMIDTKYTKTGLDELLGD